MSESEAQHQSNETQGEAVIASDVEAVLRGDGRSALDEQIRLRAYELYRQRGSGIGDDMNDWLQAESECRAQLHGTAGTSVDEQHTAPEAQAENHA